MANAWIIRPLPFAPGPTSASALPVANAGLDYAGVVWRSAAGDSAYITFDLGANVPVDTILLFGLASAAGLPVSVNVALATTAQGSGFNGINTGSGTGSGNYWGQAISMLAGSAMPVSGLGILLWSAPSSAGPPAAVRYVQFACSGMGATNYLQISRAVIGKRIQPERNFSFGAEFGVRDLGSLDFSRRGVLVRNRGKKLRTVGLTFSSINKDEVETSTKPLLEQIGNTEMIAVVTDPEPHEQRQNRCFFGSLVGDLGHVQRNARGWEAKVNLVSIF